ncbi:hypothetical protein ABZ914_41115 [Spirillospora sp. NPDC046719]
MIILVTHTAEDGASDSQPPVFALVKRVPTSSDSTVTSTAAGDGTRDDQAGAAMAETELLGSLGDHRMGA